MNSKIKWFFTAAFLIVLITAASILYRNLSRGYAGNLQADVYGGASSETQSQETQNTAAQTDMQSDSSGDHTQAATQNDPPDDAARAEAPNFTVTDYAGNKVILSDYRGTPVVLNFWATWCGYCKQEMPDFDAAYESHPEVQFLMVNVTDGVQETVETAKSYIEKQGFSFPVFFDTENEAARAYYITGLPATFFIDKDGCLIAHGSGMLDAETLEKGIAMINDEE